MSILRGLLIIPPVVAGIALIYLAVSGREAPERAPPAERAITVRTVTATPRTFLPRVTGFGTVEPARTWSAIAQVAGRVTYVNPQFVKGAFVQENDVLIRLAPEDYELAIAQSRANIQSAAAEIEEMQLSRETIRLSLLIEQKAMEISEKDLDRKRQLVDRGAVSQAVLDTQQTAVLAQQSKVQDLQNRLALVPAQLKALEQTKAVAEAKLSIAELDLERTVIRAPFDGRVSGADVEVSQFVATGSTMGSLDGIDAAEIVAQIPPSQMADFIGLAFAGRGSGPRDVSEMTSGLSALSAVVGVGFVDDRPAWDGRVTRISDTVDPQTRSIGVIVTVPAPYEQVRPGKRPPLVKGMFAEAEIRAPPVDGLVLVPRNAIVDGTIRIVDADDRLRIVPVSVRAVFRDAAILESGIEAGATVIVSDPSPAVDGMPVTRVADAAAEARLEALAMPADLRADAGAADR